MKSESPIIDRFMSSFAEEMGRWSAKAIGSALTFAVCAILLRILT